MIAKHSADWSLQTILELAYKSPRDIFLRFYFIVSATLLPKFIFRQAFLLFIFLEKMSMDVESFWVLTPNVFAIYLTDTNSLEINCYLLKRNANELKNDCGCSLLLPVWLFEP